MDAETREAFADLVRAAKRRMIAEMARRATS